MKIKNSLITSIACLKRHFDFREVFNNIDIFVRDLSPQNIPYQTKRAELLYTIIANPSAVAIKENTLAIAGGEAYALQHNEVSIFNNQALQGYQIEDQIRIVALFELVGSAVDSSQIGTLVVDNLTNEDVVLSADYLLPLVNKVDASSELVGRIIRVDSRVARDIKVEDVTLKPDGVAYGLFSKAGMYKVLKPASSNSRFSMKLTNSGGVVKLRIADISYQQEQEIAGVYSFCAFGEDNYLYIANNQVYSYQDPQLSQLLKSKVGILDIPMAVEVIGGVIVVTMQNGTELKINYKQ